MVAKSWKPKSLKLAVAENTNPTGLHRLTRKQYCENIAFQNCYLVAREPEKHLARKRNVSQNYETFFLNRNKRARKQWNITWKQNFRNNVRRVRGRLTDKFFPATFLCVIYKSYHELPWWKHVQLCVIQVRHGRLRYFRGIRPRWQALLNGHAIWQG